jgi:hypothetical protein
VDDSRPERTFALVAREDFLASFVPGQARIQLGMSVDAAWSAGHDQGVEFSEIQIACVEHTFGGDGLGAQPRRGTLWFVDGAGLQTTVVACTCTPVFSEEVPGVSIHVLVDDDPVAIASMVPSECRIAFPRTILSYPVEQLGFGEGERFVVGQAISTKSLQGAQYRAACKAADEAFR